MSASFLPAILVPLTCFIFPAVIIVFMTVYAENDNVIKE